MITRLIKPHLSSLALPLSLTETWNDINPWSQLQMRSQLLLRMAIDAEGYKLSKWWTPEMMTCSSWLSWPFSWSTLFVGLYLSPLNLKINCYYLLPFPFAAGDCYMLNSWWQLMLAYIVNIARISWSRRKRFAGNNPKMFQGFRLWNETTMSGP